MKTKKCTKCGEEKPATLKFFYKNSKSKDNLRPDCKICTNVNLKKYADANKERKREYDKKYNQINREKKAEWARQYYESNKEKKKEYDRFRSTFLNNQQCACIYQIINTQNGMIYVGETLRGLLRWRGHIASLKGNYHDNSILQADFNKYGEEAFEWKIIKKLPKDKQLLVQEEKIYIKKMISQGKKLYNKNFNT